MASALWLVVGGSGLLAATTGPAQAHQFRPVLVQLTERAPGLWTVDLTRDVGPGASEVQLRLPAHCSPASPPQQRTDGPVQIRIWTVDCGPASLRGASIAVTGLAASGRTAYLTASFAGGERHRATLHAGAATALLAGDLDAEDTEDTEALAWLYLRLGIQHIATGIDHLAFVACLLLLVGRRPRRLLATITAFTVGHSLTLGLATLGWLSLAPAPTEALIALSIVWVAAELARAPAARSAASRHPWLVALAFGLLHGFGFAGALVEVGLPAGDIPLALLLFNAGVEVGQLLFIAGCLLVHTLLAGLGRHLVSSLTGTSAAATRVFAYTVGSLACYWTMVRIAALWRGGMA